MAPGILNAMDAFSSVSLAQSQLQAVHSKSSLDLDNVETLFSTVDTGRLIGRFPGLDNVHQIDELRAALVTVIVKTIENTMRQVRERAFVGEAWQDELGLVFTEADGSPLSRHAITRRFQRILVEGGLPKRPFHNLRHTSATLLLAQGIPLRVVMEILGHSQMATTSDLYAHVLPV